MLNAVSPQAINALTSFTLSHGQWLLRLLPITNMIFLAYISLDLVTEEACNLFP